MERPIKQRGWCEGSRSLQIEASTAFPIAVIVLIVWGLLLAWRCIEWLAVGFMGLTFGTAVIRSMKSTHQSRHSLGAHFRRPRRLCCRYRQ